MSSAPKNPPPAETGLPVELVSVRYSLPQMLAELRVDRATGSMASEKLDQVEITKLFKKQPQRRGKSRK
jgi:hypothetical protein